MPTRRAPSSRAARVVLVSSAAEGEGAAALLALAAPEAEVTAVASLAECARVAGGRANAVLLDASTVPVNLGSLGDLCLALPSIPVVVLSSAYEPEQVQAAIQVGVQDWLPLDPGDPAVLRLALRHAAWRHERMAQDCDAQGIDALTGILNRASFERQFERAVHQSDRAGRQLAFLLANVTGLSAINDGVGHDVGDLVLTGVASRLTSGTRRSDSLARVGGNHFAVLLHDVIGEHSPAKVARGLLGLLAEPITINGDDYWVGSNIGISMFPRDGQSVLRLMGHAEVALHQAHTRGSGEYRFYSEGMNDRAHKRLILENNLRRALQRGGLRLVYQPQVDTRTGALVGAEALVRWSDPDLGEMLPHEFIPVAEQTGLIVPLGEWVLRTAVSQLSMWKREGMRGVRMSVNVSAHQLEREDFRETVVRALWDANLEPGDLVLEVTESAVLLNEKVAIETLGELARRGVGISLDDFGTGFSSLSFLKRFPVESVKIDRAFMQDLAVDPDDRAIVVAILSIAKQLRLSVIAEGVETHLQRSFLEENGCDEIQGFLISPGVGGEEFVSRFWRAPEDEAPTAAAQAESAAT